MMHGKHTACVCLEHSKYAKIWGLGFGCLGFEGFFLRRVKKMRIKRTYVKRA